MKGIIKCDCGFGPGWYHVIFGPLDHEFNPMVDEAIATHDLFCIRNPIARAFHHSAGQYVKACIDREQTQKIFYYLKAGGRESAMRAAVEWIQTTADMVPF